VRHIDHIVPANCGGPTTAANGQGLCEHCNQAKEAPGWRARPGPAGQVVTTTPTGHEYASNAPPLPREPAVRVDLWAHDPAAFLYGRDEAG
jgi:hypothetical protein